MSPSSYIIPTLEFGDLSRIMLGLSRVYLSLLNYVRLWASTKCSNYFKFHLAFFNQDLHPHRGFPSLYTRTTQIASLCYKLATTVLSLVVFPQACESMQHQRAMRVSLKSELWQPSAWCADVCQYIGHYRPQIFYILWFFLLLVLSWSCNMLQLPLNDLRPGRIWAGWRFWATASLPWVWPCMCCLAQFMVFLCCWDLDSQAEVS